MILKGLMKEIIPESIIKRKKQGFSAPDESWYRGENLDYVKDVLLSSDTKMDTYINKRFVERILKEHIGGINHRLLIWSFISFEEWCKQFNM